MKLLPVLLLLGAGSPALAATYTVAAGTSLADMQTIVNEASSVAGNTVAFAAGAYSLENTLALPCSNGTVYTGPNVGTVTQTNLPTAVFSSTVATNFAMGTDSNGSTLTGSQGCMIQYFRFTGTQGGIIVWQPASGITIQQNAFDNNNPPVGGGTAEANIFLYGNNAVFTPASGVENITIEWNTFFNNCAAIRAAATTDSGGRCASTWVQGYNNGLVWSNNTVNLTEEALKLNQQYGAGIMSLNADVENNNLQGNSRILIESQQETNGVGIYSHNAFYQPFNPGFDTFELSMPQYTSSLSPTHTANDNVLVGNVPVAITGSGAHYGIGMELWGAGTIVQYNLLQGGNGASTCGAGWGCSGWNICIGEAFTNATVTNNYFSGTDVWSGTANNVANAVTYEDNGSSANPGLVVSPNTVVQTSTVIPTVAPSISASSGTNGTTITLSDSDTEHRLSIFYTTDGSTPAIFHVGATSGTTRVYSAPFTVAAGSTVRAIASWGQGANQGIVFPSFGYGPSTVVSFGAQAAATARTVVGAYLSAPDNANTILAGKTMQFTVHATYSDGTTGTLPDSQGNKVSMWNTSNHRVAKISNLGHATGLSSGTVDVQAVIGNLKSSPWTVTVQPAQAPAAQAAAAPAAAARQADTPNGAAMAVPGPMPSAPGAPLPDSFQGPFWKTVTPNGGSASISNAHLFLGVPGGGNHDPLNPSNQAVRVVQAIGNQDFDVAIKIDSPIVATDGNTNQGLMVLSDDQDFITFALATDGSRIGLSIRTVSRGVGTTVLEDSDFSQYQNPMCLRLARTGSAYVAFYSTDGVNWVQASSFTNTVASTSVGLYASNYSSTPANAVPVVMSVNWFDVEQ